MTSSTPYIDPELAVADRYSRAARAPEAALCCPVDYDPRLIEPRVPVPAEQALPSVCGPGNGSCC